MLNRTDSLTHGDCGNQDMVTIAELCLNRIESYTTGLSGYKYSAVVVDCNSDVWAFLLRAFCPNISCPNSGIQPFFASLQSDLEQMQAPHPSDDLLYIMMMSAAVLARRLTGTCLLISAAATRLPTGHRIVLHRVPVPTLRPIQYLSTTRYPVQPLRTKYCP